VNSNLSAQNVIAALLKAGVLDEGKLVTLLGERRATVSLNDLEIILVEKNILSVKRLAHLKGVLSGRPIVEEAASVVIRPDALPLDFVRRSGSLVVDKDPLTVVMVEDVPEVVEAVSAMLGTPAFDIWLMPATLFDELLKAYYLGSDGDDGDVEHCKDIFEVLTEAVRRRASDIHLSAGLPPSFRVDGSLSPIRRAPLPGDWLESEMSKLTTPDKMDHWRVHSDVDFAYTFGAARFRVNIGKDRSGITVALRKIPTVIPTMDDLGLPSSVRDLTFLERGLVLVVGPTGSGKSTTLAAMLSDISTTQSRHIITLEDPVEFLLPSRKSVVHQRELGQSFYSFPGGLRQALRQDPDIILVGEMRDAETMRTAMTAAETGHLVFGTLHTFDAASTVARIVSSFPPEEQDQVRAQLAYILKGVVAQSLLPLATSKGRVAAMEVMLSTPGIQNNLRKVDGHNLLRSTIETSSQYGMRTMEMALLDLVKRGVVRLEDAEHRAADREEFRRRVEREGS
jgi:twitching motility protein PilT